NDQQEVQQIMLQPVIDVNLLPVHIVDANNSLYEAAHTMTKAGLKHVLIRPLNHLENIKETSHGTGHLLGILTDSDICRAVSEQQDPATTLC
ncbi:CBS domain-containing protein, partial [Pseudomonas sp. 65/3-MNA-CIBAN-0223]